MGAVPIQSTAGVGHRCVGDGQEEVKGTEHVRIIAGPAPAYIMRVHFTKRLNENLDSNYLTFERESITFMKDLEPRLVPRGGEFTIGNDKYRYWGEIPRLQLTATNGAPLAGDHYLEVIVEEIE
jgi:hypothetical protein